jgi:hypothetical protein
MTAIIIHGYLNDKFRKLWNIAKSAKKSLWRSSKGVIGTKAIAVDTQKRKLFYLKKTPNASSCLIIDLNNLEKCTIKKEYNSITAGELKVNKLHLFLKRIFLNLKMKNSSGTVTLTLYDAHSDGHEDVLEAEVFAHKWEKMISNIKPVQTKEIA